MDEEKSEEQIEKLFQMVSDLEDSLCLLQQYLETEKDQVYNEGFVEGQSKNEKVSTKAIQDAYARGYSEATRSFKSNQAEWWNLGYERGLTDGINMMRIEVKNE